MHFYLRDTLYLSRSDIARKIKVSFVEDKITQANSVNCNVRTFYS